MGEGPGLSSEGGESGHSHAPRFGVYCPLPGATIRSGQGSMTMRSLSVTSSIFLVGAVLTGCGGGSPAAPTPSLPAGERLAIVQQMV